MAQPLRKISGLLLSIILAAGVLNAQRFSERALAIGVDHYTDEPSAMGGGVAIFDFDNDGFEDLYLTGGDAADQLYHNLGDGTFEDVSHVMRLTAFNIVTTMGVTVGDVDNDGFDDLFVTTAEDDRNYLLRNVEGRYFQDISLAAGIRHEAWSTTAAMADYDGDGDLDIYVSNYLDFSARPFEENILSPAPDFLYRNEGNGTFQLLDGPLQGNEAGCTLVSHFSDFDRDGDPDLFILNDFGDFYQPNKLLLLDAGNDSFRETGLMAGFRAAINSMGIAASDLNGDGLLDYYVTNIGQNPLYLSTGDGSFTNLGAEMGVNYGFGVSWGTVFTDVDNDGYEDLFFANGDLSRSAVSTPNNLFLGAGPGLPFLEASTELPNPEVNKGRGVSSGDFNNDGQPELVVSNVRVSPAHGANSKIYWNEGPPTHHWLSLLLEGVSSNRSAIGSIVEVYAGGRRQIRELSSGGSYLSCSSQRLSFGLGQYEVADSVVIHWPRPGGRQLLTGLWADRHYEIRQGEEARLRTLDTKKICPGESLFLENDFRTEAGVFRDVLPGINRDTVLITRLIIGESGSATCPVITDANEELLLFPNPVRRPFTLRLPVALESSNTVKVRIYAADGRAVRQVSLAVSVGERELRVENTGNLPSGIYLVRVWADEVVYQCSMALAR